MKHFYYFITLIYISFACNAQRPDVVISIGHSDFINTIDISPDLKYFATGSGDKLVKVNELSSGREIYTFSGNDGRINFVKFDDNSKYVAANINSGEIKIWKLSNGKLFNSFKSDEHARNFDFCFNNTKLVYILDAKLALINWATDSVPKIFDNINNINCIKINTDKKTVFVYDYKANIYLVDLKTGNIIRKKQIFKKYKYPFSKLSISRGGDMLALAFADSTTRVYKSTDFSLIGEFRTEKIPTDVKFDNKSQNIITTDNTGYIRIWSLKKKKQIKKYKITKLGSSEMIVHPKEDILFINDGKVVHFVKLYKGKIIRTFKSNGNKVVNMAYDGQGKYLAAATGDLSIKLWNLKENKIEKVFRGFFPAIFSPDGKTLFTMGNALKIVAWDVQTGKQLYLLDTKNELIQNLAFSKDGKYMSGAGFNGVIKIWDIEKHKIIKQLKGHKGGIYATCFSPDGKLIASSGMDQTIRIYDFKSGKQIKQLGGQTIIISDVKFSPDGKILASAAWDKTINLWNTQDWTLIKTLKGHTSMILSISFNNDGSLLASSSGNNSVWKADNSVIVWNVKTGEKICSFKKHTGSVKKVIFDNVSNKIFSSGDDGQIKIWNPDNCNEIASLISVGYDDYVILTPDNYYTASRDALKTVSFRINGELYSFEQFDIRLNRPDIIAQRIGYTPQNLIKAYNYVYKKRLRKMGFKESELGKDFTLPKIEIKTKNIPLITSDKKIKFTIHAKDDNYNLNRLNVYINDVPLYGLNGISLKDKNTKDLDYDLNIDLISGSNQVQVSVLNDKGVESLKATFNIIRENSNKKGNLYIIAMGVSNYKDKNFRLKYPAKDANDVINELKKAEKFYNKIYTIKLTDSLATKENFLSLKDSLKNMTIDDAVLFFIAGHGVLDENYNYYYGTYDMDFDNPSKKGLSYDAIENLISSVKSLKKLLIMDTCHSGELDKEEIEQEKNEKNDNGNIKFRAAGIGVRQKEGFGIENSNNLMQNLFSDIRKGSGATVISSAGGAEYAMESDTWHNGLFTYCMLKGLKNNEADLNNDKKILISELQKYVYQKVSELSKGKQKPTARAENLIMDYRIK